MSVKRGETESTHAEPNQVPCPASRGERHPWRSLADRLEASRKEDHPGQHPSDLNSWYIAALFLLVLSEGGAFFSIFVCLVLAQAGRNVKAQPLSAGNTDVSFEA